LIRKMETAARTSDRRGADRLLVESTRWLKERPKDAAVHEARERLRRAFPPDPRDV
jgi:hypothetical protein